jgi:hypothetical protein
MSLPISDDLSGCGFFHEQRPLPCIRTKQHGIYTHFCALFRRLGPSAYSFVFFIQVDINPNGRNYASGAEDGYVRLHHFDKSYLDMKDPVPEADEEDDDDDDASAEDGDDNNGKENAAAHPAAQ